jgi:hypothetical protein
MVFNLIKYQRYTCSLTSLVHSKYKQIINLLGHQIQFLVKYKFWDSRKVDILIFDRYEIIHSHSNLSIVKKVIPYKVQCRQVSLYNKITPKKLDEIGSSSSI